MSTARQIVENRVNGLLGVGEATVQQAGDRRILVELPGEQNPEAALNTLQETGLLEFVDMGSTPLQPGTVITTDFGLESTPTLTETNAVTPTERIWHTVMTG